jgi:hypothetical protein
MGGFGWSLSNIYRKGDISMPTRQAQPFQDEGTIDFNKRGKVVVKNGLVGWTPKPDVDPALKQIVDESVKALNEKIKAGELTVDSKGRIK